VRCLAVALLAGGLLAAEAAGAAPGTPVAEAPVAEVSLKRMLSALQSGSYDDFLWDAEPPFREALKRTTFDAVAAQVSPRLKGGYTLSYLGTLNQVGYAVSLWKITFKDGGDDVLAKVSTKDGRVGGFFLQ
jgi:hypothetical protein